MFKELKSGYPIYLFDRASLKYEQAKVMNVQPNYQAAYGKMEVNVTVQTKDGNQNTYSVADAEQTAYAGSLLIACAKECVINEVRAINAQAEETLGKVSEFENTVKVCNELLETLDTSFREQQATDKRLSKLEEGMAELLKIVKSKT